MAEAQKWVRPEDQIDEAGVLNLAYARLLVRPHINGHPLRQTPLQRSGIPDLGMRN